MDLNIADIVIIATILVSTLIGVYRGFIREMLTIITIIIAGVVAYMFGKMVGEYFTFIDSAAVKETLGMIAIFIGVILVGFLLKVIICKACKISNVSPVDRVIGAVFGALRGALLVILVILFASKNISSQDWYVKSKLMPRFVDAALKISNMVPHKWKEEVKEVKEETDELIQKEIELLNKEYPAEATPSTEEKAVIETTTTVIETTTTDTAIPDTTTTTTTTTKKPTPVAMPEKPVKKQ